MEITVKGKKRLVIGIICLTVLIIVGYFVGLYVQDILDGRQEVALFEKYRKDVQWKQVIDMMVTDKKDLATPGITKAKRAGATMDLGLQWFNLREFKFAAKWWEKGLDIEPKNSIGWYNLGNAYRELKKYSKAKSAYRKSMDLASPEDTNACLAFGDMYKYDLQSSEEEGVYLDCLKKHKDDRDLIMRLAVFYRDSGDRQKALTYFDKLFSIEPTQAVGDEIHKLQGV